MSNQKGRFGIYGGQYIPETLMNALIELETAYNKYKVDPQFNAELTDLLNNYENSYLLKERNITLYQEDKVLKKGIIRTLIHNHRDLFN
mgnify:CR=1 FL=1